MYSVQLSDVFEEIVPTSVVQRAKVKRYMIEKPNNYIVLDK